MFLQRMTLELMPLEKAIITNAIGIDVIVPQNRPKKDLISDSIFCVAKVTVILRMPFCHLLSCAAFAHAQFTAKYHCQFQMLPTPWLLNNGVLKTHFVILRNDSHKKDLGPR